MSKDKKKHKGLKSLTRVFSKRFHRHSKDASPPGHTSASAGDEPTDKKSPQKEKAHTKAVPSSKTQAHTKEIHAIPVDRSEQPQVLPAMSAESEHKKQLAQAAKKHKLDDSDWDDLLISSDDEEEDSANVAIPSKATASLDATKSKSASLNDWFEKYIPGWRFLLHNIFRPVITYNLDAADAWVEKLFSFLPIGKHADSIATTESFLPMYQQMTNVQQLEHKQDPALKVESRLLMKPRA